MDLNQTPFANRTHIAFFGIRNAGKSSIMNALTNQNIAVVSPIKGTTTDPVHKAMELLPLGPVNIIDTAGLDDIGELGKLRIEKTKQILNKTDIAILVIDATLDFTDFDRDILKLITDKNIPYIVAYNKVDLVPDFKPKNENIKQYVYISAKEKTGIEELKSKLVQVAKTKQEKFILKDIVNPKDTVILVIPIDKAAPKGRLILPQQQVIRELLDIGATAIMTQDDISRQIKQTDNYQDDNLENTLANLKTKPKLIITDSQVFGKVNKIVPQDIELTSFSILFSRYKGDLKRQVNAVKVLDTIKDDDKILIAEGCTHHRQCDDIGTVKLPNWIKNYTKANPEFIFTSGTEFPDDLSKYKLIIHCGGCMLNQAEMQSRLKKAHEQNIPMSNYGTTIAYIHGILNRTLHVFSDF